jgi:putative spermidine/putrescine transport system permease protein
MAVRSGVSRGLTRAGFSRRLANWPLEDIIGAAVLVLLATVALVALLFPMLVIVLVSFDSGPMLRFPPQDFSLERYAAVPQLDGFLDAITLSLGVGLAVVAIDVLLGVPAAITLVRGRFRGKSLLIGFLQSPMMVPGIVIGVAILLFLSFVGQNVSVPLMLLSHVVITLPFVVRITYARMESANRTLEEAAEDLGASRSQVFRHVVLPHLMPGIVGGSALAFLLSFDNLPVSIFTAPVIGPPLPVYLFHLLLYEIDPIVAPIATLQILITFVVLGVAARTLRTTEVVGTGK